jgi:hypothetical protein
MTILIKLYSFSKKIPMKLIANYIYLDGGREGTYYPWAW